MIPDLEKRKRIKDISKVLIPELIPDQLRQLGITEFCGEGDKLSKLVSNAGQGINFINLLLERSQNIAKRGGLYSDIETIEQPSQLSYTICALNLFMKEATLLTLHYPVNDSKNAELYARIDRLTYLAICAGYFSGHNDALAVTDRHTNAGYAEKVLKPQSGGKAKSSKYKSLRDLTIKIANHIYRNESIGKVSKPLLAEAIHTLISDFSSKNSNIKPLQIFQDGCPEISTIEAWLKPIKKIKKENNLKKPSLNKLIENIKKDFPNKEIKKLLN